MQLDRMDLYQRSYGVGQDGMDWAKDRMDSTRIVLYPSVLVPSLMN